MVNDASGETSSPQGSFGGWLVGGGEMGERIRAFDWSKTAIGSPETWSAALRMMVRFLLVNRFPLLLWWGPEYVSIYNDAYRPVLGTKHPWGLGRPLSECWSEIWDVLKPLVDTPFKGGPPTWNEDIGLEINRHGFLEETHFTVAYSPVPDESVPSGIGGVLATVHEITDMIVSERRVVALRDLGARATGAKAAKDACAIAANTLARHSKDIPFLLLYLVDTHGKRALLAGTAGVGAGTQISPLTIDLAEPQETGWPLAQAFRSETMLMVERLNERFAVVPSGPWSDPPHTAALVPIPSNIPHEPAAVMVAGVSTRLRFDDFYRDFLALVKTQIATAIANARAYEEERRRAEALAEIDRAKTAFFSNVSHEFRTPLTLMLGSLEEAKAELARSASSLPRSHFQQVELAHRSGLRLLKLVNTLLDFSRIEAGRVQAVYEPTDLAFATTELASVFRSAIEKADLKLTVDCPPLSEPAYVDREMWEKIVLNLVSNAFKFTFEGEIEVGLRESGGHIELAVRDTGTGIPGDELPKLFERFHRVPGARGRTHEGSGIGLALVQELVKLHGGSVSVDSRLGHGSTFTVTIPVGRNHLPDGQIGAARTQASTALGATPFVEEALRWLPGAGSEGERVIQDLDVCASTDESPEERARIVLADDNADMRDYLCRLLAPRYEVEAVADGEAALAAIARYKPDLVLSDIMMPRLDGMQMLARLRSDPQRSTVPVILVSARAGEESRVEGIEAGADDYLIKPFSARELLARVETHVKMARFRRESTQSLRESEQRLRIALSAGKFGSWELTLSDFTLTSSDQCKANFGRSRDDPFTYEDFRASIHPEDRKQVAAAVQHAIERIGDLEADYRCIWPNGSVHWINVRGRAVDNRGEGRATRMAGITLDITERKQAEETQQLLVDELNHRVKNTLAAVQAIAQHTLRKSKDPTEFVESFAGRIQSLARVHSLLTAATWRGADLRDLIHDQLLQGSIDETRITAWGPPVRLEAQMTLHLALVLHELGTNAHKYGALSAPSGWVTIGWTVEGGALRLRWQERGGPPVTSPTSRGFGTTLIEQSVKSEGGSARMSVGIDGVLWEVTLPLPEPIATDPSTSPAPEMISSMSTHQRMQVAKKAPGKLAGTRFMVVEDEPLVALDIAAGLEEAGAEVVAATGSAEEALDIIEGKALDAALLDGNLHGSPVGEIAAALTRRKVPFVFVTGYGREGLPQSFRNVVVLSKPFTQQQLIEAAARLIERRGVVVHLRES